MIDFNKLKNIPSGYDSPIEFNFVQKIAEDAAKAMDEAVMQAVIKAGFSIDKDKLVSALQQDKERYDEAYHRGFFAGYNKKNDEITRCRDCLWFHQPDEETGKKCKCNFHGGPTEEYKFCWWGERNEDDA